MRNTLGALVWHFGILSMVAIGGANAILPQIHADVVTNAGWLAPHDFTELVAIAQMAPGPNLLIVPLIGWRVAGWLGAVAALLAFVLPSAVLTVFVGRALARHAENRVISALRAALPPVAASLLLASGIVLGQTNGGNFAAVAIAASVAMLATFLTINPLWWIVLAAAAGVVFA